jgi:hypothetical protein
MTIINIKKKVFTEDEMGRTYRMNQNETGLKGLVGKAEEKRSPRLHRRRILKWILKRYRLD